MAIVASTLARIKADPLAALCGHERINDFFTRAGHVWRRCTLDPATTLKLFILQILNGNAAISALRLVTGLDISESSYCDARTRLPVTADFGELSRAVAAFVDHVCSAIRRDAGADADTDGGGDASASASWRGHRVLIADATSTSTPDQPVLQDLWPRLD